ncbi:hypothetical protein SPLC1_S090120 [Arthrospira platensis C1]|nr:hypothetical protein SPLC1_S090120 [Arthrospira platensis C1]
MELTLGSCQIMSYPSQIVKLNSASRLGKSLIISANST